MSGHPFPWRIERDWTLEIRDANNAVVAKVLDGHASEQAYAVLRAIADHPPTPTESKNHESSDNPEGGAP